jgi:hypothetical protein
MSFHKLEEIRTGASWFSDQNHVPWNYSQRRFKNVINLVSSSVIN